MKKPFCGSTNYYLALILVAMLSIQAQMVILIMENPVDLKENSPGLSCGSTDPIFVSDAPQRSPPWNEWETFRFPAGSKYGCLAYDRANCRLYQYNGGDYYSQDYLPYFDMIEMNWVGLIKDHNPGYRTRCSNAVDEDGGKFYIYGGSGSSYSYRNDLWSFDFETRNWTELVSDDLLSIGRTQAAMVFDHNTEKIYIHMGRGNYSMRYASLEDFYSVDLTNGNAVTLLNNGSNRGMKSRYDHDMCIDAGGRYIYVWGGTHRKQSDPYNQVTNLKELWRYSIPADSWSEIGTPPGMGNKTGAKMFYHSNDNTINIWGGRNGSSDYGDVRLWRYYVTSGQWTALDIPGSPHGRELYARHYSAEDDLFYVFGGGVGYYPTDGDLNCLNLSSNQWTIFPEGVVSPTNRNGILGHDQDLGRLYYIGPFPSSSYDDPGAYVYYFDLEDNGWVGPIYNTGTENPHYRKNTGLCYVPSTRCAYMYGGGYTSGYYDYHDLSDFWKIDLATNEWTRLHDDAPPGKRQGFEMVYNPNDRKIYFYGGYYHETTDRNSTVTLADLYTYSIEDDTFSEIEMSTPYPEGRWGSGLALDEDLNRIYLFGGYHRTGSSGALDNDLWRYDVINNVWTELNPKSKPPTRGFGKIFMDPDMGEIYLTGGGNTEIPDYEHSYYTNPLDDMYRYSLFDNIWSDVTIYPNPGPIYCQAVNFISTDRDLWLFGGSTGSKIGRLGIPRRISIREISFINPENGNDLAYAMKKPYTFRIKVAVPNDRILLTTVQLSLLHADGTYTLRYNADREELSEIDKGDFAEVFQYMANWEGKELTITVDLIFHWNWTSKTHTDERRAIIEVTGKGLEGVTKLIGSFLNVNNKLTFSGDLSLYGSYQGSIKNDFWVRTEEVIKVSGLHLVYKGTDDIPPQAGSCQVRLWEDTEEILFIDPTPGEMLNFSFNTPSSNGRVCYSLNITGVPDFVDESECSFNLNIDGEPPSEPKDPTLHADSFDDPQTSYDNDLKVFLSYQGSDEPDSGVMGYYWNYTDRGGTREGNLVLSQDIEIDLPGNGSNTIYIWSEDKVRNIGPASNASIFVDDQPVEFKILSPDITSDYPNNDIELKIRIIDVGGSFVDTYSVQYRYTNRGQGDTKKWLGSDAWKYLPDYWSKEERPTLDITLELNDLSDSEENFFQLRASDGTGELYTSKEYKIVVNPDLRYPIVELVSPIDGHEYGRFDDVVLEWKIFYYDPEQVDYEIYVSRDKEKVEALNTSVLVDRVSKVNQIQLDDLLFGWYYWTVIPITSTEWIGTCDNGVFSFYIDNIDDFDISVYPDKKSLSIIQGKSNFINFNVVNIGKEIAYVTPAVETPDFVDVSWELIEKEESTRIEIGASIAARAFIEVASTAPVAEYTLTFYFNTSIGISKSVNISLLVVEAEGDNGDIDDESNIDVYIILSLVVISLIIFGSLAFYFLFVKDKKGKKSETDELEEIYQELGLAPSVGEVAPETDAALETMPPQSPSQRDIPIEIPERTGSSSEKMPEK